MFISTCLVIIAVALSNGLVQAYPASKKLPQELLFLIDIQMKCSQHELKCLGKGQISHTNGECYTPLERGPCPKDQRFVLHPKGDQGRRGRCAAQPCPPGAIQLVPLEGRCLEMADARELLCARGELYFDATGSPQCGGFPGWPQVLKHQMRCLEQKENTRESDNRTEDIVRIANILCAKDDKGLCVPKNTGIKPSIVLKPEDDM